jgi:hypothetical protein
MYKYKFYVQIIYNYRHIDRSFIRGSYEIYVVLTWNCNT